MRIILVPIIKITDQVSSMNFVLADIENKKLPEFEYTDISIQPVDFLCNSLRSEMGIEPNWLYITYCGTHADAGSGSLRIYYKSFFPYQFGNSINSNFEPIGNIQHLPDYDQYAIMLG